MNSVISQPLIFITRDPQEDTELILRLRGYGVEALCYVDPWRVLTVQEDKPRLWRPKMFFIEMILNGESGFEIAHRLRRLFSGPQVPIVMVTPYDPREDIADAYNHGANLIIQRPLTIEKIHKVLKKEGTWHNPAASYSHMSQRTYSAAGW